MCQFFYLYTGWNLSVLVSVVSCQWLILLVPNIHRSHTLWNLQLASVINGMIYISWYYIFNLWIDWFISLESSPRQPTYQVIPVFDNLDKYLIIWTCLRLSWITVFHWNIVRNSLWTNLCCFMQLVYCIVNIYHTLSTLYLL